jgi:hypothetical protein
MIWTRTGRGTAWGRRRLAPRSFDRASPCSRGNARLAPHDGLLIPGHEDGTSNCLLNSRSIHSITLAGGSERSPLLLSSSVEEADLPTPEVAEILRKAGIESIRGAAARNAVARAGSPTGHAGLGEDRRRPGRGPRRHSRTPRRRAKRPARRSSNLHNPNPAPTVRWMAFGALCALAAAGGGFMAGSAFPQATTHSQRATR